MKKILLSGLALVAMAGVASASLYNESWTLNGGSGVAVPDGSLIGIANSQTVSDVPSTINGQSATIQDISVNLDISGGYNADLYGYLVFQPTGGGTASMEVLLNQIGTSGSNLFGDSGAGMNVTLSDSSGNGDIHSQTGSSVLSGSYTPDSGNTLDGTFGGISPDNGTWTLFLADLSVGGGTSTLVSWGLGISVVPEPVTWALGVFAALAAVLRLIYWLELKARVSKGTKDIEKTWVC